MIVGKRYKLDKRNAKVLLSRLVCGQDLWTGVYASYIVDVSDTPFYLPVENPDELQEVLEAIAQEFKVEGLKVEVTSHNQIIKIRVTHDENSNVPAEKFTDEIAEQYDDQDPDDFYLLEGAEEPEDDDGEIDMDDFTAETFEEFVAQLLEDEDYKMESIDIIHDGADEE